MLPFSLFSSHYYSFFFLPLLLCTPTVFLLFDFIWKCTTPQPGLSSSPTLSFYKAPEERDTISYSKSSIHLSAVSFTVNLFSGAAHTLCSKQKSRHITILYFIFDKRISPNIGSNDNQKRVFSFPTETSTPIISYCLVATQKLYFVSKSDTIAW